MTKKDCINMIKEEFIKSIKDKSLTPSLKYSINEPIIAFEFRRKKK